jgi:hypothetical protein
MSENWFEARFRRINGVDLQKKAADATFKSIGQAAGTVRKIASRSIRRSKNPSKPGNAPNTQTGLLRRAIRYEISKDKDGAVIGPVNDYAKTIWDALEYGGRTRPRRKLKVHKHRVGDYGPVEILARRNNGKDAKEWQTRDFIRVRLRTAKQAARADRLIEAENRVRARLAAKPIEIKARPFMGPALEKIKARLPAFWRNAIK